MRSAVLLVSLAGLLAACSSTSDGGSAEGGSALSNLLRYGSTTLPEQRQAPPDDVICPYVFISDGGSAVRVGGESNASLRYQLTISETARECTALPNGGMTIKVGVQGLALLGPAGGPGTFSSPFHVTIRDGNRILASRSRTVSVTVPRGQTQGEYMFVEDGFTVPPDAMSDNVIIEVGFGRGPSQAAPARSTRRR
ncbi:MAG: hypothetical protein DIU59_000825 [Pseudomonadota bacterium]|jgi:hypothetical protein